MIKGNYLFFLVDGHLVHFVRDLFFGFLELLTVFDDTL